MESPIQQHLERLHAELAGLSDGTPYALGPAGWEPDPNAFGICLATVDGHVYSAGAADEAFSIHSLSKPLSYALALADHGREAVDHKVDVEPSGDPFNEISLAEDSGRPANAMINAGALAVTSMIKGGGGKSAPRRIADFYSRCAGRRLSPSRAVFDVEMRHSDRNHALAYLLSSFGIIDDDPTRALENYLRQCSIQVTCRDLALMAATLANGGTHPRTQVQALDIDHVERVLSVMLTSGMYDDAGSWVSSVGMPAKSGVGGGILAVLPGQVGVGVFSPPLDVHGNSVRGVEVCRRLSADMEMHFVRAAPTGRSAVRQSLGLASLPSRIRRTDEQTEVLERFHDRSRVIEVTGDLLFAGTESLVRAVSELEDSVELVVLDMRWVNEMGGLAVRMLAAIESELRSAGRQLVLIDPKGLLADTEMVAGTEAAGGPADAEAARGPADAEAAGASGGRVPVFMTRGGAVEYCENRLLAAHGTRADAPLRVPVEDSPALASLSVEQRGRLAEHMEPRRHEDGDIIRRVGQRFGGVHFIVSGRVNTIAADPDGERIRLNTLRAGMTFGELALGSDDRQETTEKAVGAVELMVLTPEAIDALEEDDPALALALWRALTRDAYLLVDRYLRESAVRMTY